MEVKGGAVLSVRRARSHVGGVHRNEQVSSDASGEHVLEEHAHRPVLDGKDYGSQVGRSTHPAWAIELAVAPQRCRRQVRMHLRLVLRQPDYVIIGSRKRRGIRGGEGTLQVRQRIDKLAETSAKNISGVPIVAVTIAPEPQAGWPTAPHIGAARLPPKPTSMMVT